MNKSKDVQGGSQKLLLTTKRNLLSPVVFFLDHPVYQSSEGLETFESSVAINIILVILEPGLPHLVSYWDFTYN